MKRSGIHFALFCSALILLPTTLHAQINLGNNTHINMSMNGKHTYQMKKNGRSIEFEMKGEIEVNESDTEIVYISKGGYIEMKEKQGRTRHDLVIRGLAGDRLEYKYKLNGKAVDFEAIDRGWYEDMLLMMIRETGAGAKQRTARILKIDGVEGLFDEIDLIESSSSRVRYMTHLFDQADLNDDQLLHAATLARDIPSSGDRSRFLKNSAGPFLASAQATPNYFNAVESIPSSGDKTRVLNHLVNENLLTNREAYLEAIGVAKSIPSSGDRSRFLINAADLYIEEASDLYFDAVRSIPSSGDKTRVLMKLVSEDAMNNPNSYNDALRITQSIPSSGDRARFLMAAAANFDNTVSEAYFEAVNTIPSSGDHARVLIHLQNEVDLDHVSLRGYLLSARGIASSGDKTRVLIAVANSVAGDDKLVDVYVDTAESISASGDYKRALSALMD